MADPVTLATISIGSSAAGGVLNAFGAAQKGAATASLYNYQAGIAQFKERIALQNRDYALTVGEDQLASYGLKSAQLAGKIKAAQGASNIDVGSGSAVDVQKSQKLVSDIDMATIRKNAARRAYGYEVEAATQEAQAGLYTLAASKTEEAIPLEVTSSLISGASSVSSKWLQAQQAGIFA